MPKINCKKIRTLRLNSIKEDGTLLLTNDLAKEVDLCYEAVSRMENDYTYNPGVLTLLKVSEYFKVTIDSLVIKE